MSRFEFATATRIIFGKGTLKEAAAIAAAWGQHALVVTGLDGERTRPFLDQLAAQNITVSLFTVTGEPTVATAVSGVQQAQTNTCDLVISIGGGSAIDTGKAIAGLATNPGDPLDYLEVVGRGRPLTQPPLPFIAIPTTAGTGAEVTRNA
ncbi:MAG: iron-containing alcohol dehydrogenase, partial [Anaerolineales bacterium]|nr:iron-containing alcohol dehydrogenase [Anaerolineales bacterium]